MSKKKVQRGLEIHKSSGPPTMSTVKNSTNYTTAEVVIAFNNKSKSKLVTIARNNKEVNPKVALFAVLCWLYLEKKRELIVANETVGPNWRGDEKKLSAPLSSNATEIFALFNELKAKEKVDTAFFELSERLFWERAETKLRQLWIENVLQEFYPNSYYFGPDNNETVYKLRSEMVLYYKTFFTRVPFYPPTEFSSIGVHLLDRLMSFVYSKEANKRGGANQIARFKVYQLFNVVFLSNYDFTEENRNEWRSRFDAWINLERYLFEHSKVFEKKTTLLKKHFPTLVTCVQNEQKKTCGGNKGFSDEVITERMRQLKII